MNKAGQSLSQARDFPDETSLTHHLSNCAQSWHTQHKGGSRGRHASFTETMQQVIYTNGKVCMRSKTIHSCVRRQSKWQREKRREGEHGQLGRSFTRKTTCTVVSSASTKWLSTTAKNDNVIAPKKIKENKEGGGLFLDTIRFFFFSFFSYITGCNNAFP